jgi:hypothetical protein
MTNDSEGSIMTTDWQTTERRMGMRTRTWMLGGLLVVLIGCGKSTGGGQAVGATGVTLADLVGTWDVVGSGTVRLPDSSLCAASGVGEFSIAADGALTEATGVKSSCQSGTIVDSDTGTVSVDPDGSGTITYASGDSDVFQVSKDKNLMALFPTDADEWSHSVALRR